MYFILTNCYGIIEGMKKLLLVLIALTSTSILKAEITQIDRDANVKDSMEECQKDYDSALFVMQQRQKDNNLVEAMKHGDKKLVMSAYSQPQQKTIYLRIEATENFANHAAQKCFRHYKWLWSDKRNE